MGLLDDLKNAWNAGRTQKAAKQRHEEMKETQNKKEPVKVEEPTKITVGIANGGMLLLKCPHGWLVNLSSDEPEGFCEDCAKKVLPILQKHFDVVFEKQQASGWMDKDALPPFVMR